MEEVFVKIQGADGQSSRSLLGRDEGFRAALRKYCSAFSLDEQNIRLYYRRRELGVDETPNTVQLRDGDVVEALSEEEQQQQQQQRENNEEENDDDSSILVYVNTRYRKKSDVMFLIKNEPMSVSFKTFCRPFDLDLKEVEFSLGNRRLEPDDTPVQAGLFELDVLDARWSDEVEERRPPPIDILLQQSCIPTISYLVQPDGQEYSYNDFWLRQCEVNRITADHLLDANYVYSELRKVFPDESFNFYYYNEWLDRFQQLSPGDPNWHVLVYVYVKVVKF